VRATGGVVLCLACGSLDSSSLSFLTISSPYLYELEISVVTVAQQDSILDPVRARAMVFAVSGKQFGKSKAGVAPKCSLIVLLHWLSLLTRHDN
jgi:hypothetical protein